VRQDGRQTRNYIPVRAWPTAHLWPLNQPVTPASGGRSKAIRSNPHTNANNTSTTSKRDRNSYSQTVTSNSGLSCWRSKSGTSTDMAGDATSKSKRTPHRARALTILSATALQRGPKTISPTVAIALGSSTLDVQSTSRSNLRNAGDKRKREHGDYSGSDKTTKRKKPGSAEPSQQDDIQSTGDEQDVDEMESDEGRDRSFVDETDESSNDEDLGNRDTEESSEAVETEGVEEMDDESQTNRKRQSRDLEDEEGAEGSATDEDIAQKSEKGKIPTKRPPLTDETKIERFALATVRGLGVRWAMNGLLSALAMTAIDYPVT
jgi:hypothetical protein